MTTIERDDLRGQAQRVAEDLDETVIRLTRLRDLSDDRGERAAEQLEEELRENPLSIDTEITVRVTLGTGGPAHGVDFTESGARAWYQDWFTPRVYADLDDVTADYLRELWYVGFNDNGEDIWE